MNRIRSVDVIKIIAVTGVIVIHAAPFSDTSFEGSLYRQLEILLSQSSRFAVPFFFVVSGYFFGVKERRNNLKTISTTVSTVKRLLLIFVAWSLIYLLPYNVGAIYEYGISGPFKVAYWNLISLSSDPIRLIFHGTKAHLWFLAGLIWAVLFTGAFRYLELYRSIYIIAIILYILGLLGQSYSNSPFGIHFNFDIRNHVFFSTIFFVTGYGLSNYKPEPLWFSLGVMIFVFGAAIHFTEIYTLWKLYGTDPNTHSYTIGTYCMGVGITLAALSNPRILNIDILAKMGKYVLGIYVIHYIFVDILSPVSQLISNPLWEIGKVLVILLLSAGAAMLLSKNKYMRKIVE
ncbi:Surface polysaccharide O-acyltransferase, integral membrane enzyme [Nitrosospira sp. Nsp18]|uniref:acyltransferase n=1 Tax=Nitrosospira sp. Nsp18 TaxID=1855334 RepID=UPI0008925130|nr:acyltransferase [Nitrosospira sp. Nsp18]SDA27880.1 Surface polysaccharide O-acyltransferase, integral membrane enzyme [Nitrosospira sp. Nsp18]